MPAPSTSEAGVTSPADIYTQYVRQKMPKSILKQSASVEHILPEEPVRAKHLQEIAVSQIPVVKVVHIFIFKSN